MCVFVVEVVIANGSGIDCSGTTTGLTASSTTEGSTFESGTFNDGKGYGVDVV